MPKQELAIVPVYRRFSESSEIDWNQVLIDASISALQGIQEIGKLGLVADALPDLLSDRAVRIGKAMVERLKREICPEISSEVSELSPERSESRS